MNAFDRLSYESDHDKPAETAAADRAGNAAELDVRIIETRTHGEAYADLRQSVDSGWDRHRRFDAPHAELARFAPEQARLPAITIEQAVRYVGQHRADRPWLAAADRGSPQSRRIIAAIDQGAGHGHIRHEGWVTEEASMRRAAYLEDPAQLDAAKQNRGIDGLKPNDRRHVCADLATRITDPDAFATAFARGAEHPNVRAALSTPYDQGRRPDPVQVPIADLLGKDGHKLCTGWQLEPVEGSMSAAMDNRRAASSARRRTPARRSRARGTPSSNVRGRDDHFRHRP